MNEIFQHLWQIQIPLSLSIGLLLVARSTILKKISARWTILLWIPIILQCLIPIPIKLSLYQQFVMPKSILNVEPAIMEVIEQFPIMADKALKTSLLRFDVSIIWILGCLLFVLSWFLTTIRLNKEIQPLILNDELKHLLNQFHLPKKVYTCAQVSQAALKGCILPSLLLGVSFAENNADEKKLILMHEQAHYQKGHCLLRGMIQIISIIYWFNPLILLMRKRIYADLECIADEIVVQQNPTELKNYACLIAKDVIGDEITTCSWTGIHNHTKERLINLMNKKKTRMSIFMIVGVLFCITLVLIQYRPTNLAALELGLPNFEMKQAIVDLQAATNEASNPLEETMIYPVDNLKVTCGIGCYWKHQEIDVKNEIDRYGDVYAVYSGEVIEVGENRDWGNYIVLSHALDRVSNYHNLDSVNVKIGDIVNQGDVIGNIGMTGYATGPHVGFSLIENGKLVDFPDWPKIKVDE